MPLARVNVNRTLNIVLFELIISLTFIASSPDDVIGNVSLNFLVINDLYEAIQKTLEFPSFWVLVFVHISSPMTQRKGKLKAGWGKESTPRGHVLTSCTFNNWSDYKW